MGMGGAEIILYIFTVFFLFYSMRAFLQARSKEFGILAPFRDGEATIEPSYFH